MIDEIARIAKDFDKKAGQGLEAINSMDKPPQCQNHSDEIVLIICAR
jgi:hypothetical protein